MRTDDPKVEQVLLRVFSLYSAMLLLAASGLALFAHEVFLIFIGPQFREAYRLVPFLTFAYCIFYFGYCFSQGILVRRAASGRWWSKSACSPLSRHLSSSQGRSRPRI
jgi:O-antigen/teichoic acid export membrane protein